MQVHPTTGHVQNVPFGDAPPPGSATTPRVNGGLVDRGEVVRPFGWTVPKHLGGARCLAANPARTLLAVGGDRGITSDVHVLDTSDSAAWRAVQRGKLHTDCVFDLAWLDDEAFVTGGRDGVVAVWNAARSQTVALDPCAVYKDVHHGKVRLRCVTTADCAVYDNARNDNAQLHCVTTADCDW